MSELDPSQGDLSDTERLSDEMTERYTPGHKIHPTLVQTQVDVVIALDGLQDFDLKQSDLPMGTLIL